MGFKNLKSTFDYQICIKTVVHQISFCNFKEETIKFICFSDPNFTPLS